MIRPAESSDIEPIAEMGERFLAEHPIGMPVCRDSLVAILEALRTGGALLLAEQDGKPIGFLAGALHHAWFDVAHEHPMAIELAWWVEPEHRSSGVGIRLLKVFERWAAETPAQSIVLSDLVRDGDPSIGDMTARLGYQLIERSHVRSLT